MWPFANTGSAKNRRFLFSIIDIGFPRFEEFSNPRSRPVSFKPQDSRLGKFPLIGEAAVSGHHRRRHAGDGLDVVPAPETPEK
jgi:hypothetical protein